jgi:hypothetical protein
MRYIAGSLIALGVFVFVYVAALSPALEALARVANAL